MRSIVWGARLITPEGRTLLSAIRGCHCTYFSADEPTYWPTDQHRITDLLDFFVARGVAANYVRIESVFELYSDHSPIIATIRAQVFPRVVSPTLVTHNNDECISGLYY